MSLFGKKKRTLDEIIEEIKGLSPDEQAELASKLNEAPPAEEAPATEAADAEPAPEADVTPAETACTDETPAEPTEEPSPVVNETPEEPVADDPPAEPATDPVEGENIAEMVKALTDRVNALEGVIAELSELKEKMDEYVSKQKDAFGYKSEGGGARKNYDDMSADELKNHILHD